MDLTMFEFTNINILLNCSPERYFEDLNGDQFYEEVMLEATVGANKGNIFQRLWNLIKKFFAWISQALRKIINFITGRKNTVDVNQVLQDCQVTSSDKNAKDFFNKTSIKNNKATFTVKNNKGSDVELSVPMIMNGVMCVCRDKNLIISILPNVGMAHSEIRRKDDEEYTITDNKQRDVGKQYLGYIAEIVHNLKEFEVEFAEPFLDLADKFIKGANVINEWNKYTKLKDYINKLNSMNRFVKTEIKQGELDNFQKIINKCYAKIEEITSIERITSLGQNDAQLADLLNMIGRILANLQMGINALVQSLSSQGAINPKYFNSIHNVNKLSQVVNQLMERGVSAKYMEAIIYTISGPELCGDKNEGDGHFIAGESRCILFPKNNKNIVYKVGYSRWGVSSNKSEVLSSDIITSRVPTLKEYIAKAAKVPGNDNYIVTQQERIEGDELSPYDIWPSKISNLFDKEFKNHNVNLQINDLHYGNMIMPKGKKHPIVIDYGWSELATSNPKIQPERFTYNKIQPYVFTYNKIQPER